MTYSVSALSDWILLFKLRFTGVFACGLVLRFVFTCKDCGESELKQRNTF